MIEYLDQAFTSLAVTKTTTASCKCKACHQQFSSANALEHVRHTPSELPTDTSILTDLHLTQHSITHFPLTVRCYACPRKFRRHADMLIHLESGTCASGVNLVYLNSVAATCFHWKKYVKKDFRVRLLNGDGTYRSEKDGGKPFVCPTCGEEFPLLSSLFAHVWSSSCKQSRNGGALGKLKRWLWRCLAAWRVWWVVPVGQKAVMG